jgi:hypothetical protein
VCCWDAVVYLQVVNAAAAGVVAMLLTWWVLQLPFFAQGKYAGAVMQCFMPLQQA